MNINIKDTKIGDNCKIGNYEMRSIEFTAKTINIWDEETEEKTKEIQDKINFIDELLKETDQIKSSLRNIRWGLELELFEL